MKPLLPWLSVTQVETPGITTNPGGYSDSARKTRALPHAAATSALRLPAPPSSLSGSKCPAARQRPPPRSPRSVRLWPPPSSLLTQTRSAEASGIDGFLNHRCHRHSSSFASTEAAIARRQWSGEQLVSWGLLEALGAGSRSPGLPKGTTAYYFTPLHTLPTGRAWSATRSRCVSRHFGGGNQTALRRGTPQRRRGRCLRRRFCTCRRRLRHCLDCDDVSA